MTSQLNVDTIVDKAGSGGTNVKVANNAVAVAEGGGATTNVVQGLAKSWCYISASGNTLSDSLNTASVADNGTGSYQANFTNNMNNVLFSQAITSGSYANSMNCEGSTSDCATSQFRIRGANSNETSAADIPNVYGLIHGDLA
jgi:hypothetical protein